MSPIPQRYNLKAIHNKPYIAGEVPIGVTNTSKIQSESNSQPSIGFTHTVCWCHQYLKDTIWKQFTTRVPWEFNKREVSPIPQRYNLKAIHNTHHITFTTAIGVTNTSKIQSESNSQPCQKSPILSLRCHQYLKDTIWKQFTTGIWAGNPRTPVSPIPQRYNLKAIHNKGPQHTAVTSGVTNTSKIQSESNSQLIRYFPFCSSRCHQYLKDTIWKQFTTPQKLAAALFVVSPIPQRYNLKAIHNSRVSTWSTKMGVTNTSKIQSESNSQPPLCCWRCRAWCHQYLKDTIWKQFTTAWICKWN